MQPTPLTVNGRGVSVSADRDTPLLDVLRNHLGLKGSKFGCGLEQCGCCMVLIDGEPAKSCGKGLATVAGKAVLTIEGLGTREHPQPLQQAFLDEGEIGVARGAGLADIIGGENDHLPDFAELGLGKAMPAGQPHVMASRDSLRPPEQGRRNDGMPSRPAATMSASSRARARTTQ